MTGTKESNGVSDKVHFIPVEDPTIFLPILKERHPHSCFMHNQVTFSHKFKNYLNFYTLSDELNSESWLISTFSRDDNGRDISISAPNSITREERPIPEEIKECFSSGNLIDWDGSAFFIGLEKPVSLMILDISSYINGNISHVYPDVLFYLEKEDALALTLDPSPGAELRRLDQDKGTDFIASTWRFAKKGSKSVISQCIGAIASAGVYVDGKIASGVVTFGDGMLHCLYTSNEYRKRGFAKLTMQYCYKELAKDGCYPCSSVDVKNKRSIAFHEAIGAKRLSVIYYVEIRKFDLQ